MATKMVAHSYLDVVVILVGGVVPIISLLVAALVTAVCKWVENNRKERYLCAMRRPGIVVQARHVTADLPQHYPQTPGADAGQPPTTTTPSTYDTRPVGSPAPLSRNAPTTSTFRSHARANIYKNEEAFSGGDVTSIAATSVDVSSVNNASFPPDDGPGAGYLRFAAKSRPASVASAEGSYNNNYASLVGLRAGAAAGGKHSPTIGRAVIPTSTMMSLVSPHTSPKMPRTQHSQHDQQQQQKTLVRQSSAGIVQGFQRVRVNSFRSPGSERLTTTTSFGYQPEAHGFARGEDGGVVPPMAPPSLPSTAPPLDGHIAPDTRSLGLSVRTPSPLSARRHRFSACKTESVEGLLSDTSLRL